jgi:hypothetical protein
MKWKLWLRNLSVSAPRVAVRTQLPWAVRATLAAVAAALAVMGLFAVYQYGRNLGVPVDHGEVLNALERAREQLRVVKEDRDRYAAAAVQSENQLKVERAAQDQLAQQLKAIEGDNARLRGDLAFFESLLPAPSTSRGVVIRSFKLQPDADDNTLRYRLLVQQSGRPDKDFVGAVEVKVNLLQAGRPVSLTLPDAAHPASGPAPLAFRHYQRVEGTFSVPEGATVRSVQVTINSGGEMRAQQTFAM